MLVDCKVLLMVSRFTILGYNNSNYIEWGMMINYVTAQVEHLLVWKTQVMFVDSFLLQLLSFVHIPNVLSGS